MYREVSIREPGIGMERMSFDGKEGTGEGVPDLLLQSLRWVSCRERIMTLLPESQEDRARLLELFVLKIQTINKKSGTVFGSYQILSMLETIAVDEGMIPCPHCGRKR